MKKFILIALLVSLSTRVNANAEASVENVVQAQVDAYNARNIDSFLATYANDAELFEFPNKRIAKGTAELRERYAARFKEEGLHATIVKRIVLGNMVVDHEQVRRTFPEGAGTLDAIAIYEVENGKIARAWLRLGEKKLDSKN
jgi:hypothetical protein